MIIDGEKYKLPNTNFLQIENVKKQIVIGHTFNRDMRHFHGWLHWHHIKYLITAAFTIDAAGVIYKHFEPKYQSKYLNDLNLDSKSIVILLENDGWLVKDISKNRYINWVGDIYKKPNEIIEKKWRGYSYWAPYSNEQIESSEFLVKVLCEEFNITMTSVMHNTKIDSFNGYEGVIYKSNLEKHYTDLSPAWDCTIFKEKIEND